MFYSAKNALPNYGKGSAFGCCSGCHSYTKYFEDEGSCDKIMEFAKAKNAKPYEICSFVSAGRVCNKWEGL